MANWGKTDFKQLQALQQRLNQLEKVDWDKVMMQVAQELSQVLLNKVKKRTPVGHKPKFDQPKTAKVKGASGKSKVMLTRSGAILSQYWSGYVGGTLRDSWGVTVTQEGEQFVITITNPQEYASYDKTGHFPTAGESLSAQNPV